MILPDIWRRCPLARLAPAAAAAWGAWTSWRAEQHYQALGVLTPAVPAPDEWPSVSIVIPARDESATLPTLLGSLRALTYTGPLETIVVDDVSSDSTGALAAAYGARVLRLEECDRPAGWLGKPNACQRGAACTGGEWLLFLDADTTLAPSALEAILSRARTEGLDVLSLFLRQRCATFWERLLLAYAFQQFFAGVSPRRLTDPHSREALLNGQCILIRRTAYDSIGGHGAVRDSIVEDVALARILKAAGHRTAVVRGEAFGTVRMYRSLAQIRAGFAKNAYAFLADEPRRGARVAVASTCASLPLPLLAAAAVTRRPTLLALGLVAWAALATAMAPWTRRFGAGTPVALLQPLAALLFQTVALESTLRRLAGRPMAWKGRTYRTPRLGSAHGSAGAGDALPFVPRLPLANLLGLSRAIVRGERRSLRADSTAMVRHLRGAWQAEGLEHLPPSGPVCLVVNHWQRPGLWIGWGGALLGFLVGQRRPALDPPVHWLVLAELRPWLLGAEWHLPFADLVLRRVAHAWQMAPLSVEPGATASRAHALRHLLRLCAQGRVAGFFPEGHRGTAGPPGSALPGAGRFLATLARRGVAVVPAALWEEDGLLRVRIGPSLPHRTLSPARPDSCPEGGGDAAFRPSVTDGHWDTAVGRAVMDAIAALLPPHLRPLDPDLRPTDLGTASRRLVGQRPTDVQPSGAGRGKVLPAPAVAR